MSNICNELRISILQAALQGKLSKRLPEDGTAKELLDEIHSKKTSISKKVKPLTDDDKLFTIPDTWEWVKFGEVVDFSMGKTPPRADASYWGEDIPWVSIADMPENDVLLSTKEKVSNKALKEKFNSKIVPKGTLIMSFKLTVGRCSILGIDAVHNEAIISIKPIVDKNSNFRDYLAMALPFLSNYGDTKEAIKGKTLNSDSLNNLSIPLPPLTEQKRIVEKVDEFMARVAVLEQSADALASLKKAFPDDIKASLLQAAMQGKLTKQLPEDGSAEDLLEEIKAEKEKLIAEGKIKKQKPLASITDDEIPFSIPENWRWVRLDEIANSMSAGKDKPKDFKKEKDESHPYPVIANGVTNDGILGYTGKPTAPKNTLTVAGRGTIGFSLFREYEYCPIVRLIVVDLSSRIDPRFVQLVMQAFPEVSLGTSIPQLTVPMLRPKLVPLPPLAEQKRIIERLDTFMQNINVVGDLIASE